MCERWFRSAAAPLLLRASPPAPACARSSCCGETHARRSRQTRRRRSPRAPPTCRKSRALHGGGRGAGVKEREILAERASWSGRTQRMRRASPQHYARGGASASAIVVRLAAALVDCRGGRGGRGSQMRSEQQLPRRGGSQCALKPRWRAADQLVMKRTVLSPVTHDVPVKGAATQGAHRRRACKAERFFLSPLPVKNFF